MNLELPENEKYGVLAEEEEAKTVQGEVASNGEESATNNESAEAVVAAAGAEEGGTSAQTIKIVDVEAETQRGNLVPQLLAIRRGLIDLRQIDNEGYQILHHAAAFNKLSAIVPLIEEYSLDVDVLSTTQQTVLMIASNYGFLRLEKYLLSKGANINLRDSSSFSSLLFAVKNNNVMSVLQLLMHGADLEVKDLNGCGVVHWAAYNNNVFLLQVWRRLGLKMTQEDHHGYTPFVRALFNEGYDSLKYLVKNIPGSFEQHIIVKKIESPSIRNYLTRMRQNQRLVSTNQIYEHYLENTRTYTLVSLMLCAVLIFYAYTTGCMKFLYKASDGKGILEVLNWVLIISVFAYVPLLFRFIGELKTEDLQHRAQHERSSQAKRLQTDSCAQFAHLDKLLKYKPSEDEQEQGESQITFLHEIALMFKNDEFESIRKIPLESICVPCLRFKKERQVHCRECETCVDLFGHHSDKFEACIARGVNHKEYYTLLSLQQFALVLFFLLFLFAYWERLTSSYAVVLFWAEIPYLMLTVDNAPYLRIFAFLAAGVMLVENTFDWIVETQGVLFNLTRYEIMHRFKCWYFFENLTPEARTSKVHRYYKNKFWRGLCGNISDYFADNASN